MDAFDRMGKSRHPHEEDLERYVMKAGSKQETEAIEEHLLVCEACRTRLPDIEEYVATLKMALPLGPRSKPSRFRLPQWHFSFGRPMAMAGCAAVVAAMLCIPLLLREPEGVEEWVKLSANRGGQDETIAKASSRNHLTLQLDVTGLDGPLEARIVDKNGAQIYTQTVLDPAHPIVTPNARLKPGRYYVRVISREGKHAILRETGLQVQ